MISLSNVEVILVSSENKQIKVINLYMNAQYTNLSVMTKDVKETKMQYRTIPDPNSSWNSSSVYAKDEEGKIMKGYSGDDQHRINRRGYCLPENLPDMLDRMIAEARLQADDIREAAIELADQAHTFDWRKDLDAKSSNPRSADRKVGVMADE